MKRIGKEERKNPKYAQFTDDEIYMLSRQAMEASGQIMLYPGYTRIEKDIHKKLMNELIDERRYRDYYDEKDE